MPNRSIERTANGRLRRPPSASHVQRRGAQTIVFTLRCTQKLLRRGLAETATDSQSDTVQGDWYANRFAGRVPMRASWIYAAVIAICLTSTPIRAQPTFPDECRSLAPKDHTQVIAEVQAHLDKLILAARERRLDVLLRTPQNLSALLRAISEMRILSEYANERLNLSSTCLLAASQANLSDFRGQIELVARELVLADSVPNAIDRLGILRSQRQTSIQMSAGLQVTAEILQDGLFTIYADSQPAYRQMTERATAIQATPLTTHTLVLDTLRADGRGAITGAVSGCILALIATGVGCPAGAVGGGVANAIGNSTMELMEKGWKFLP